MVRSATRAPRGALVRVALLCASVLLSEPACAWTLNWGTTRVHAYEGRLAIQFDVLYDRVTAAAVLAEDVEVKAAGSKGRGCFATTRANSVPVDRHRRTRAYPNDTVGHGRTERTNPDAQRRRLAAGTFLGCYEAEVLDGASYLARYGESAPEYVVRIDGDCYLDGAAVARDADKFTPALLNHAAAPEANVVRFVATRRPPRIDFFTSRTIQPGDELAFNYGNNFWDGRKPEAPASLDDAR